MARKWTREERRVHIREKYYGWREKAFTMALFLLVILFVLYLAVTGTITTLPLQAISGVLVIIMVIIFLLVAYDTIKHRNIVFTLMGIFIILVLAAAVLIGGAHSEIERFVFSVIFGIIFIILIAVAAFFIDLATWESG